MELDITTFFYDAAPSDYSASRAEIGDNAGPITWQAAVNDAADFPWLDTDDKRDTFRAYLKGFGAWDDAEIAAFSNDELSALLIQMIAGDMREGGLDTCEPDWKEYEAGAEAGTYSGRIYRGDDGRIYYYIGD